MALVWIKTLDDDDNTMHEAESSLFDDPAVYADADTDPLQWVITPKLVKDAIAWTLECSDFELIGDSIDAALRFTTLELARAHCERRETELIERSRP